MPRVNYVGPTPVDDGDLATRLQASTILDSGPVTRVTVDSAAHDAALLRATKSYVDTQDALYALDSYPANRDALNTPVASRGAANGTATLDSGSKVPLGQIPVLGAGYLKGPFGPTAVFPSTATTTPVRIADFDIGVQSVSFRPLFYATVMASTVELRTSASCWRKRSMLAGASSSSRVKRRITSGALA